MVKSAKSDYAELIARDKVDKEDSEFLTMWHQILNISESTELLKINKDQEKFDKDIKEKVSIY